ncbi:helix-turn-helix domain-containing protein [Emticicia sp. BO119]|uniref:helix-turn-helix domain-containing protein n=1 Tax=Emticicia sp. BO119 TaxID=2757768 RepID=UPI0015F04000|nr:helix-turn-helix domain-containing protein [Emticicia sp. BO119]MBA4852035.1 helix-turn-helix domain-containing protein [Emticicia sp. BO119]
MEVTHNNLPEAVALLLTQIGELKQEVKRLSEPKERDEVYLTLESAAEYLGTTKTALRQNKNVPSILRMRKLYFKKSDLQAWLEAGKVKPKPNKVFVASS